MKSASRIRILMDSARDSGDEQLRPRWTIPKRTRLGNEDLHVSSFVLVKNDDSVLFLRAGGKYPVQFRRGKLLLPAAIVDYGESPRDVAQAVLARQLSGSEGLKPKFLSLQSYLGAHWDLVLVFESRLGAGERQKLQAKEPFTEIVFCKLDSLPRDDIASDHLEVIDELLKEDSSN